MRTELKWLLAGVATLTTMTGMLGCASELDENDPQEGVVDEIGEQSSELTIGPSGPARLTLFSEGGFWGRNIVSEIPESLNESSRAITKTQVDAAGMFNQISSVRLACGARAAEVILFRDYNTTSTISGWSTSTGYRIQCTPGTTTNVNLHVSAPSYADRAASAYFVAHASGAESQDFVDLLTPPWNFALREAGVTTGTAPIVRMLTPTRFTVRQSLVVDYWLCTARGAVFELSANMVSGVFTVTVVDSYVDSGFGDLWTCRSGMKSKLDAAAASAARSLENSLDDMLTWLAPGPRDYFVPRTSFKDFWIYSGGYPALVGTPTPENPI